MTTLVIFALNTRMKILKLRDLVAEKFSIRRRSKTGELYEFLVNDHLEDRKGITLFDIIFLTLMATAVILGVMYRGTCLGSLICR